MLQGAPGKNLDELGRMAGKVKRTLEDIAQALAADNSYPDEALRAVPDFFYEKYIAKMITRLSNHMWKFRAKKNGGIGDAINGHIEAGYRSFIPGKMLRTWSLALSTYRTYDFSGDRTDEYYNFTAAAQFLNYWNGSLYLSYDPQRFSHYLTRGGPMALYPYGAYNYSFSLGLRWKPSDNLSLSISPGYSWRHSVGQYVRQVIDPLKTETYDIRYILSDIIQETVPLEIRINWTFSPQLSLQAYVQPYIGVGDFFLFKELRAPRTFEF